MLLTPNNNPLNVNRLGDALKQIKAEQIPSGFSAEDMERAKPSFGVVGKGSNEGQQGYAAVSDPYKSEEASRLSIEGIEQLDRWHTTHHQRFLLAAEKYFGQASIHCYLADDPIPLANTLVNYADVLWKLGKRVDAFEQFELAADLHEENHLFDRAFRVLGEAYQVALELANWAPTANERATWQARLKPLRQRSVVAYTMNEGHERDDNAFGISPGEIAISNQETLGADHIESELVIALKNPATQKMLLASIINANDLTPLGAAIKRLSSGSTEETVNPPTLLLRMLGGRIDHALEEEKPDQKLSRSIIHRTLQYLDQYGPNDIQLLSACLLNRNNPSLAVISQETFEFSAKWPGIRFANEILAKTKQIFETSESPLHLASDLTVSNQRPSVFLSREIVSNMRNKKMDPSLNIESVRPIMIEYETILRKKYQTTLQELTQAVEERVRQLRGEGFSIPEDQVTQLKNALGDCPMHIGAGSKLDNQKFFEFIQDKDKKLFKQRSKKNKKITIQFGEMKKFELPQVTFEALAARLREQPQEQREPDQSLAESLSIKPIERAPISDRIQRWFQSPLISQFHPPTPDQSLEVPESKEGFAGTVLHSFQNLQIGTSSSRSSSRGRPVSSHSM
jgi:hypothetical protein